MKTFISLIIILVLTSCSVISPSPTPTPPPKPGSGAPVIGGTPVLLPTPESIQLIEETPEEGLDIQQLLLVSHTRWQNVWADGQIIYYAPDGSNTPVQTIRVQVWISQPGKSRVLVGDVGGSPVQQTASDGAYYKGLDGTIQPIADFVLQPFNPPGFVSDTIYPHPMASLLNTPLSDLIFPTALAQRIGEYRLIGQENFIGRNAYKVEWRNVPDGPVIDQFLVDTATGIILRHQNFGKQGTGALNSQLFLDAISFEELFPEETFYLGLPLPSSFAGGPQDITEIQP